MARFEDRYYALKQGDVSPPPLDAVTVEAARRYVSPDNKPPAFPAVPPQSYRLVGEDERSWSMDVYPNTVGPYTVVVALESKPVVKWADRRDFVNLVVDFNNQATLRQQSRGNATHVEAIIQRAKLAAYDLGMNEPLNFYPSAPPYRPPVNDLSPERTAEIRGMNGKRDAYKRTMITGGPNGYR